MHDLETMKRVPASAGLHDVIASRWSPRAFSDRQVSSDDLRKIFTAAGWAPSSINEQPWRFLVGRTGDATFAKILDALMPLNQAWAKHAPVLVLSAAKETFSSGSNSGVANRFALHDTGAASAKLSLQATALGLHTHGMGGFDADKMRANFGIPDDYEIGACWALGYLGDPESLSETLKEREFAPRTRKTLPEFVFAEWDVPAKFE